MGEGRGGTINTNKTSIIVSLIYVAIAALILRYVVPNDVSLGMYSILPFGVVIIVFLFTYVFKYDYFEKDKSGDKE